MAAFGSRNEPTPSLRIRTDAAAGPVPRAARNRAETALPDALKFALEILCALRDKALSRSSNSACARETTARRTRTGRSRELYDPRPSTNRPSTRRAHAAERSALHKRNHERHDDRRDAARTRAPDTYVRAVAEALREAQRSARPRVRTSRPRTVREVTACRKSSRKMRYESNDRNTVVTKTCAKNRAATPPTNCDAHAAKALHAAKTPPQRRQAPSPNRRQEPRRNRRQETATPEILKALAGLGAWRQTLAYPWGPLFGPRLFVHLP